jgi:hypothetical protein
MSYRNEICSLYRLFFVSRKVIDFVILRTLHCLCMAEVFHDIFSVLIKSVVLIEIGSGESFEIIQRSTEIFFLLKLCFILNKAHRCRSSLFKIISSSSDVFLGWVLIFFHFVRGYIIARMGERILKIRQFGSEPFQIWLHFQIYKINFI